MIINWFWKCIYPRLKLNRSFRKAYYFVKFNLPENEKTKSIKWSFQLTNSIVFRHILFFCHASYWYYITVKTYSSVFDVLEKTYLSMRTSCIILIQFGCWLLRAADEKILYSPLNGKIHFPTLVEVSKIRLSVYTR